MCSSDAPTRHAIGGGRLLFLLTLLLGAAGCGHRGPVKPPPQMIPNQVLDVKVQQRGTELLISFTRPQTTISGLPVEKLEGVELWTLVRPVPPLPAPVVSGPAEEDEEAAEGGEDERAEGDGEDESEADKGEAAARPQEPPGEGGEEEFEREELGPPDEAPAAAAGKEEPAAAEDEEEESEPASEDREDEEAGEPTALPAAPPPSKEERAAVDPTEFVFTAQIRERFAAADLEGAVHGDRLVLRVPAGKIDPEENEAHFFAVKTFLRPNRVSVFSNMATIVPRVPPPPPADLEVEAGPDGVELSWSWGDDEIEGFRIHRRDARSRYYGDPLGRAEKDGRKYVDRGAVFGNRYIYTVTAVHPVQPLVESAVGAEREIDYEDRFAPPAPDQLVALAETGSVRLIWDASEASDVAGYFVLRREPGGEFQQLNAEPVKRLEYTDREVGPGRTYEYQVLAIDQAGNRGTGGDVVEARVP